MKTSDFSDAMVCAAYAWSIQARGVGDCRFAASDVCWPDDVLWAATGAPWKVIERAMERVHRRGFVEYGVSLRSGWLEGSVPLLGEGVGVVERAFVGWLRLNPPCAGPPSPSKFWFEPGLPIVGDSGFVVVHFGDDVPVAGDRVDVYRATVERIMRG